MTDAKETNPRVDHSQDKADLAKRLGRLTEEIDALEKDAIPPKAAPADVGAIVGD